MEDILEENIEEIKKLIKENNLTLLKEKLMNLNPADAGAILEELEDNELLLALRVLPKDTGANVFSYLSNGKKNLLAEKISKNELGYILKELRFDDMIDFLEEMPREAVYDILKNTSDEKRNLINQFLNYKEDSAASIMTIEYVELREKMTVGEAIEHVREVGLKKETVYTQYVVDKLGVLVGIVSLRKLVTSDRGLLIQDIMERDIISVNTEDDREVALDIFKKYGFLAIPVIDNGRRLTGIITVDDIMDVMEIEATEDFHKMAAVSPSEKEYFQTSSFEMAKNRLTWLLILMISATFTGSIIKGYEDVLSKFTVLSMFIPMLMDTGGNAGSQSSTLIVRALATGDVEIKDAFKIMRKETMVALTCGIILAIVNFIKLTFIESKSVIVALTVSLTLIFTVLMAKLVGATLPIIAKKLKLDPAIMAGPLISTIVDTMSLFIYFKFATALVAK
ncbi:magnesium transporter [Citroniella saccharovorans]|uniref:Magnesium transporter MgtE n=1 Tax=Citroniella saccharovorans TaxID=2053367 RepID=A0AAW9MRP0_9FIRM|nr:magnesium transporter [Citroniella saccharovorans]MEB3428641.1 magnesium transporter [Citroniella saccharovorans]